jgi:NDP-sugar pyrophosphorylase family protein
MTRPTLLVLAAGIGSRYGGLKQIEPVGPNGEAIIEYSIFDALRAGFGKIVFVIRKDIETAFRETIGARFPKNVAVDYAFQEMTALPAPYTLPEGRTKPWGTAHAVLAAQDVVREPFAVINADDFYGAEPYELLARHLERDGAEYSMAGYALGNTLSEFGSVARGVCRENAQGYLEQISELTNIKREGAAAQNVDPQGVATKLGLTDPVSMNMFGFTPEIFAQLNGLFLEFLRLKGQELKAEFYLSTALNDLIHANRAKVKVLRTSASWFGVTYREDHPGVVASIGKLIDSGAYPAKLWS